MGDLSDVLFRSALNSSKEPQQLLNNAPSSPTSPTAPPPPGDARERRALQVHSEAAAYVALKDKSFAALSSAAMRGMPELVQEEVKRYAAVKLSVLWLPRVMLSSRQKHHHHKAATTSEQDHKTSTIISVLRSGELLSCWPTERLAGLAEEVIPVAGQKGETIISEGDSCRSGLWLILSGRGHMTKRSTTVPKTDVVVHRFVAPVLMGDFALLTDELRTANVVLDTDASCFIIQRTSFLKELSLLPAELNDDIYVRAFARRERNISTFFPPKVAYVRAMFCLADLAEGDAEYLVTCLRPLCVRQGHTIVRKGERGVGMYFVCRGKAEADPTLSYPEGLSHTPTHNTTFGEMALLFSACRVEATITALQHTDLYVLPFKAVKEMHRYSQLRARIFARVGEMRTQHLARQMKSTEHIQTCVAMMRRTATLGELCSQDCLEEIARHLQPAAFVPRQTVVSAVHLCDSLCVVTCGRATVVNKLLQDPVIVKTGDVLGLSLFAVHRWLFPVQATAGCDVWSIQKTPFLDILSRHGTLHAMYHQVKKEFSEPNGLSLEEILQRGRNAAGYHRPPLLYPCVGLPPGTLTPYHFEPLRGLDPALEPLSPKGKVSAEVRKVPHFSLPEAKKFWVVLKPTAREEREKGKEEKETHHVPHAQHAARIAGKRHEARDARDSTDLMLLLDMITPPLRALAPQPPTQRCKPIRPLQITNGRKEKQRLIE